MFKDLIINFNKKSRCQKELVEEIEYKIQEKCNEIDSLKKDIAELKNEEDLISYPSWVDEILKPFSEEVKKELNAEWYRILGPFGMLSETAVYWYKDKEEKETVGKIKIMPYKIREGIFKYKIILEDNEWPKLQSDASLKNKIKFDGSFHYYEDILPNDEKSILKIIRQGAEFE